MPVAAMNHFTVLSDDLEATRRFYCDLFGFKVGWRPPFQFPCWWLYAGDTPILTRFYRPVAASEAERRWLEGLYLDVPQEWDDPYRFFRW